jgi:REP element-mobilizing transposase RayT
MYFITTCAQDREEFFGEIQNGEIVLNETGKICDTELQIMLKKRPSVEMHEYVIMPNHVHLLLHIDEFHTYQQPANIIHQSLGSII